MTSLRSATSALTAFAALALHASAQCGGWTAGYGSPGCDGNVYATTVFDDGTGSALYVGGQFSRYYDVDAPCVARWDGTSWSAVGNTLGGRVLGLAVFDDGTGPKLVACGTLAVGGGAQTGRVVVWDGSAWSALGSALPDNGDGNDVRAIAVLHGTSGDTLYAGGAFAGFVARWTGASWVAVGAGLQSNPFSAPGAVAALLAHDDGSGSGERLYAGGEFDFSGSANVSSIAVYSGTAWTTVGSGLGWASIAHLATLHLGTSTFLAASGRLFQDAATPHTLALWDGSAWSTFADEPSAPPTLFGPRSGSPLAPGLYVGGSFTHVGSVAADDVARWDGSAWHSVGGALGASDVQSLAELDDGSGAGARLHALGLQGVASRLENDVWTNLLEGLGASGAVLQMVEFRRAGGPHELFVSGNFLAIGGVEASSLATWDGVQWSAADLHGYAALAPVRVIDLGTGPEAFFVARLAGSAGYRVVHTDGVSWTELPPVPTQGNQSPYDVALFDSGSGPQLFACGPNGVWRLDGSTWNGVLVANQLARRLFALDDGFGPALFVIGEFTSLNGVACREIARWNGTTIDTLAGGATSGGLIQDLCVYDDGSGPVLHASGWFAAMGGVACASLASWNGSAWSPVGGGLQDSHPPGARLLVHDDGSGHGAELVVAGRFSAAGGTAAGGIARWNGTSWRTLDGGVGGTYPFPSGPNVFALAAFDDGTGHGADLVVGGTFQRAGAIASANVAVWTSCGGTATTFCYGDGSATACPCGNASQPGERAGCLNSLGTAGRLRVHGRASLANDTLVLEGDGMPNNGALYFQAANLAFGGSGFVFGDGVKCVNGPFVRLHTRLNVGGASSYPASGEPSISVKGAITIAGTRHYQIHYRNSAAFCTPATFNDSNGVSVQWAP